MSGDIWQENFIRMALHIDIPGVKDGGFFGDTVRTVK
jgi:hypothetical protein